MSSIAYVNVTLFAENTTAFIDCYLAREPVTKPIPCLNNEVRGVEWQVPQVVDGQFKGYTSQISTTQPTIDSIKTVRIWNEDRNTTYWVIIPMADDETVFTNNCNACCGSTPTITPSTADMPLPIIQQCPCANTDGTTTFTFGVPPNPSGLNYAATRVYFNGAAGVPDISSQQFSSVQLLVDALNYHYGAFLTFSISGQSVIGTAADGSTTTCAEVDITLVPASYCFTYGADTLVDALEINGVVVPLPGLVTISSSNPLAIFNMLKQVLIGTLTDNTSGSPAVGVSIQYTGLQIPGNFYYNDAIATGGSPATAQKFVAGAC